VAISVRLEADSAKRIAKASEASSRRSRMYFKPSAGSGGVASLSGILIFAPSTD
jgi:hypothetical protein